MHHRNPTGCDVVADDEIAPPFDSLSDEEIISILEKFKFSAETSIGIRGPFGEHPHVYRFTHDTVVKRLRRGKGKHEPYIMSLVSSQTSVRLPRVKRCLEWKGRTCIFMDFIEGDDLETVWPSLPLWRKLYIMWTIRGYIKQLQRVPLSNADIPGPFDGSGRPTLCEGRLFTENGAGPFASYADMSTWFRRKHLITIDATRRLQNEPQFDDTVPLVLVHGDISLQNVRVDKDGNPWLIDFGFSGAFPRWFEYSGMMAYDDGRPTPRLWLWCVPCMAGRYACQHAFMRRIEFALTMWAMDLPPGHPDA